MKLIPTTVNGYTRPRTWSEIGQLIIDARKFCAKEHIKADHVIYASKKYNDDGEVEHVYIYGCHEVDEKDWERIQKLKNVFVYAMHRGTSY